MSASDFTSGPERSQRSAAANGSPVSQHVQQVALHVAHLANEPPMGAIDTVGGPP
jgi:hypothetical protein